ncbi:MAG: hypothetical protein QMB27_11760, partial [Rhodospirillales bacterium]
AYDAFASSVFSMAPACPAIPAASAAIVINSGYATLVPNPKIKAKLKIPTILPLRGIAVAMAAPMGN